MDISVGVINFNTKEFLRKCLTSIYKFTEGMNFEVIVIDNNSSDGSVEMLGKEFPQVNVIANKINSGFSKAVNQSIKQSSGKYIFICNADIYFQENTLFKMSSYMESRPLTAILGPKIIDDKGRLEMSFNKRCSDLLRCLLDNVFFYSSFRIKIFEKYFLPIMPLCLKKQIFRIKPVAWVSGASFLLRKRALDEAGLMDESFFLFSEDEDFCCRLKRYNWQIYYYPETFVIHLRGKATERSENNLILESAKSKLHFYSKRYGSAVLIAVKLLIVYRLVLEFTIIVLSGIFLRKPKTELKKKLGDYTKALKALLSI